MKPRTRSDRLFLHHHRMQLDHLVQGQTEKSHRRPERRVESGRGRTSYQLSDRIRSVKLLLIVGKIRFDLNVFYS